MKIIITTTIQSVGAPFIDKAYCTDKDGNQYKGIAILLFRRNPPSVAQLFTALVIGWRK